jgi:hypothetical protein
MVTNKNRISHSVWFRWRIINMLDNSLYHDQYKSYQFTKHKAKFSEDTLSTEDSLGSRSMAMLRCLMAS